MENLRKSNLEEMLNMMAKRLLSNVDKVKQNAADAKRASELNISKDLFFERNKKLLTENNELLNLQKGIREYLNKYGESLENEQNGHADQHEEEVYYMEDLIEQTLTGEFEFNENHPGYSHPEFLANLLNEYEKLEAYEQCATVAQRLEAVQHTIIEE